MAIRIVRLGTPRSPGEGLRIGTVRRPPRGVPATRFAPDDWYDVWFPNLAPAVATMKLARAAETPRAWAAFAKRFRAEMAEHEPLPRSPAARATRMTCRRRSVALWARATGLGERMSGLRRRRARAWHSEERARLIIESIEDYAIFMLDPEGHVESWNRGAERIKGYRADEIVGRHFGVFYPPEDVAAGKPDAELEQARARGRYEDEGWRVRKDGSQFWASVVISAMRDASGRVEGFSKVTRDLTEHRAVQEGLRRAEERHRLMVESVQDYAIFRLDPDGKVASWNIGAERIKGYRAGEIIGQHFSCFYPAEDVAAGKPEAVLREAREHGRYEEEGWRVRRDGSRFWADVLVTALRTPSGELWGFAKVTRDLTARHAAEEERLRRVQAEEAVRLRDEFLSIASHELKTPLAALHMQLHCIPRSHAVLDPRVARKLSRATRSVDRLDALMTELLDSARLATRHFELKREPFPLADAVLEVVEGFREKALEAGCRVTVTVETRAHGVWDRIRVGQVMHNLLSNALKYGAAAPVEVRVAAEGSEAVLTVEDGGPGIPEDALSRIFGRFERAVPARHYGGLGLGLYVSREIVTAHGGSIAAQNVPGRGARFTVRLPLEPRKGRVIHEGIQRV